MATNDTIESPMVAFTLDFETGGLNCNTSACTQIAIHATRLDTFEKIGSYVSYIYPYERKSVKGVGDGKKTLRKKLETSESIKMDYEDRALEYSAITMDMLYDKGKTIDVVGKEVVEFMKSASPKTGSSKKPFIIGQNIAFDEGFFCQLMEYAGVMDEVKKCVRGKVDFYGNWHPLCIDTIILGQLALCNKPEITSYKLEILCENLGIELDDAHDADADVSATTNVVMELTKRMRNADLSDGSELCVSKAEKSRKHFKI